MSSQNVGQNAVFIMLWRLQDDTPLSPIAEHLHSRITVSDTQQEEKKAREHKSRQRKEGFKDRPDDSRR